MVMQAFGLGSNGLNPITQSIMQWIHDQDTLRREDYDRARRYYEGDHNVPLTDRLKAYLRQSGLEFSDNFCSLVVDALAERLTVIGFAGVDTALNEYAWQTWQANRMDDTQVAIHTDTVMVGDGYLLVDWDQERSIPRITPQMAEMIIPHYNEATGRIDWASKRWVIKEMVEKPETRLNLYFPGRIEKYIARGGIWTQFQDEGDPTWPLSWLDKSAQPLGVPVIHFRNRLVTGHFGLTELTSVIPMQDLINKTLVDLIMVLDTMAFPQRWTLNINHGKSNMDIVPGSVSEFHSEEETGGQVGEWPAASPEGILRAIEAMVQHLAGISRTPQYLFQITGGAPSGESLKMAEAGLVKKARRRMVTFGNAWEDTIKLAARLERTFGIETFNPKSFVETLWQDPESRNEEAHLLGLQSKQALGVPRRQLWREMGYDDAQIAQMEKDLQDEKVADTNLGAALLDAFSRGEV